MSIIVSCPHCQDYIFIYKKEIKCAIFRHGVIKSTNKQIPPHASKEICDALLEEDKIYGCGKPFQLLKDPYRTIVCDYI